jgi:hypothetical protein
MSLLLLAALLATAAPPEAAAPAPGARTVREADATRIEATLPGSIEGWAVPGGASSRRMVLLLVVPGAPPAAPAEAGASCGTGPVRPRVDRGEGPTRLFRLDPAAASPLEEVRGDLPPDTRGLDAADVDGDGLEDLLLLRRGRIDALLAPRFDGDPTSIDETDVDFYARKSLSIRSDPLWRFPTLGGLRTYGPTEGGARFGLRTEVPLPLTVWRRSEGLALRTGEVELLGTKDGTTLLATAPERVGDRRLRVSLLSPEAAPNARVIDCWLRLPAPERVIDAHFFLLDGSPHLAVTTTSAEELGLFSEKLLRIFPLRPDRTRTGAPPAFATETHMNLWQSPRFHVGDVTGDGKTDLVLAYWKGLKNGTAVLDTYARKPDGSFPASPRSQTFELPDEDRTFLEYGGDVTGDGIPDLMLLAEGKLQVFAGNRDAKDGRALVGTKPALSTPIAGAPTGQTRVTFSIGSQGVSGEPERGHAGAVATLDLDGDGKREVLFASEPGVESGRLVVVSFRDGAPPSR